VFDIFVHCLLLVVLAASGEATASSPSSTVLAHFDGGLVTLDEVAILHQKRPTTTPEKGDAARKAAKNAAACRRQIEAVAIEKYLAAHFDPNEEPRFATWSEVLVWDAEATALGRAVRAAAAPSRAQVDATMAKSPLVQPVPKRWNLQTLFRRVEGEASLEERAAVRQEIESLRQRLVAGEDFSQLARQHSQSSNRRRGGRVNAVRLADLAQPVAAAVAQLEAGQLSPPVEVEGGFALVLVVEELPAKKPDLKLARRRARGRLHREKAKAAVEALSARLLKMAHVESPPRSTAQPPNWLARYRVAGHTRTLSVAELEAYLQYRKINRPVRDLPAEQLKARIEERILLELHAAEARHRGLADDQLLRQAVDNKLRQLRANSALAVRVERLVKDPDPAQVEAFYTANADRLREVQTAHVRAIETQLDAARPAAFYERMRQLGLKARSGELTFEQVAQALGSDTTVQDLGWLTDDQMWLLGPAPFQALQGLSGRQVTAMVREGRTLRILQVVEVRRQPTPSLAQARPRIESILRNQARASQRKTVRGLVIEEAEIQLTPEAKARCKFDDS